VNTADSVHDAHIQATPTPATPTGPISTAVSATQTAPFTAVANSGVRTSLSEYR